ncbi:hypothetical protein VN97_g10661 [Penicillium thymicola]|uniref:Uncharacterized protein n=1 Tax=Penicillium thymicola TaxID=293382 RepID=A0AAI9T9P0_PENTH|nr:hypothetical protein VN97_g10661 [Penicillium thymicola]
MLVAEVALRFHIDSKLVTLHKCTVEFRQPRLHTHDGIHNLPIEMEKILLFPVSSCDIADYMELTGVLVFFFFFFLSSFFQS